MKLLLRPNGNKRVMKYLLSILIFFNIMSLASARNCPLQVSFYGYGDGANEWIIQDSNKTTGTLVKHTTVHPTRGEIVQRGIILDTPMCVYDVLNDKPLEPRFNDKEYTHFIIPQFYEEEECDGQLKQFYQDDIQVELSATELWVGNANYATSFAMIINNIRIPSQKWLCSK